MNEIVSPCVSICELDETSGFCLGCWRTREEIIGWKNMMDDQRRVLLKALHLRREDTGKGRPRRSGRRRASGGQ